MKADVRRHPNDEMHEKKMPIFGSDRVFDIPLAMLYPFRNKAMLYYGRTLERIAEQRGGLTPREVLELIRTESTMPPQGLHDEALLGEVSLFRQFEKRGITYGPLENKTESLMATLGEAVPPAKLPELQPMAEGVGLTVSPLGQLRHRTETLFDAIKHGDEAHQEWLKEAIRCHFAGEPMPEYVAGKSIGEKVAEFLDNVQSEQKPILADTTVMTERPVAFKLLGWRIDWPAGGSIGSTRWCGADDWKTKERLVKLGGEAVELWGDPAKSPSSGPTPWPVIGKEYIHFPGEPIFVLLGRDPQAPGLVQHWADIREIAEPGDWKIENARQIVRDMRVYKAANPNYGMATDVYDKAAHIWFTDMRAGASVRLSDDVLLKNIKTLYNEAAVKFPPKRVTVDLDNGKPTHPAVARALSEFAAKAPDQLPLALQLVDAQPCSGCGYIHTHCRCVKDGEGGETTSS